MSKEEEIIKNMSLVEFAEKYITVMDWDGKKVPLTKTSIMVLQEFEDMQKKGYSPVLVKARKGTIMRWIKTEEDGNRKQRQQRSIDDRGDKASDK